MATYNLGLGGTYTGGNPYLQSIIDLSSRDMVDNYSRTTLPAQNAALVRSGSFGNSGLEEMQRADQAGLRTSLGDLSSKLRFNDWTSARDFGEGQRQFNEGTRRWDLGFDRDTFNDAYGQNRQNLIDGLGLLSFAGGANSGDINTATTEQDAPLNYYQRFAGIAQGLGGMGSSGTTTAGTTSNPLATALGGAQLGSKWWNSSGSGSSSSGSDAGGGWWA